MDWLADIMRKASGVTYRDVIITAESNNASALPKNTDFFDSLNVEHVTVERTWVNIGGKQLLDAARVLQGKVPLALPLIADSECCRRLLQPQVQRLGRPR